MSNRQAQQLLRLTMLLQLEKRARAATADELAFVMVNETLGVLRYRQAILWRSAPVRRVVAVSGVSSPDPYAPFVAWIGRLCAQLETHRSQEIREIGVADVPEELRSGWHEWLPPHLVWLPLSSGLGALLLAREEPTSDGDRGVLTLLADAYGHAWHARLARKRRLDGAGFTSWRQKAVSAMGLMLLIGAGFIPVRQSVLAPAEIVPRDPAVIRAPLEGVVDRVLVRPNDEVVEAQTLFTLDRNRLSNQLSVALRAQEAAEAELRQARQFAVVDQKVRASLPVLQSKVEQQVAEVAYLRHQLERTEVKAPKGGLAIFDDPNDWLGRPVVIGERVMLVADPQNVQVEVRLPVADAIDLEIGEPLRLFMNIDPEHPRDAALTFVSYQAQKGSDGILGYRVTARLQDGEDLPRIGLKGTAKLYGPEVPLAYSIFRRPLSAARQWLGF
jgi:hypothetical protein